MNRSLSASTFAVVALLTFSSCSTDERRLNGPWRYAKDSVDAGTRDKWFTTSFDRSVWLETTAPEMMEDGYDGIAWYATTFEWNEDARAALVFSPVDDDADVWINGTFAGSHEGHADTFVIDCPEGMKGHANLLVVRVADHAGPGGITGPVRIVPHDDAGKYMKFPFADEQARTSERWVNEAVIYEVYLRSFSPEGTFQGLEKRLPFLKDLGVNVLWLMPIHPIGELNRKGTLGSPYSVRDFRDVNPEFGSKEDFRRLVASAHEQGLRIIIDLVANHTAWDSDLLLNHPEWYTHDEDGAIVSPNADWTDVADLNYEHHELRKYMLESMLYWIREFDIDGYRCDVADLVPTSFWVQARHEMEKIKPVMMLAEASAPELHVDAFDVSYAWTTYDVLSRVLKGGPGGVYITRILEREPLRYPRGSLLMRFHTNHDKNAWDAPAIRKFGREGVILATTLMFVLPGVPLIYNGEEVANETALPLFEKLPIEWPDDERMLSHIRRLTRLRKEHPWLSTGPWRALTHSAGDSVLALYRSDEDENHGVIASFNFSGTEKTLDLNMPAPFRSAPYSDLFSGAEFGPSEKITLVLPKLAGSICVTR